ncbi:hypothetical protein HYZ05_01220 [Candidatus Daviesbacteria bacterium]|nr:hypothetical protein [Candidatus Daviesbacteria bacterium]
MEMNDKNYKTSDFCLAAYLLAKNIPLTGTVREENNRVTFVYQTSNELSLLIDKYFQMQAMVEPMAFFAAQKRLKQIIYQK